MVVDIRRESVRRTVVVSAVNLRKGGTLTILRQCLEYLSTRDDLRVIAIVHKRELCDYPGIEYIEKPNTIKSWLLRLWCEYVSFYRISKKLAPVYLWLSLHDTTPNVKAERRAVYCHNPFPFYPWKWRELFLNYRIVLFSWFSKYIYRINIHKNFRVIVQQQWIREQFKKLFRIEENRIIVAKPGNIPEVVYDGCNDSVTDVYQFIYASFGDIHKNFELLCEASCILEKEIGTGRFKVTITVDKTLNKYCRWLYSRWGSVDSIKFAGFMSREALYSAYAQSDCLVFPSKVETWGLPISEYAATGKPMLLADLPYAHETASGAGSVMFFDVDDAEDLASRMKSMILGNARLERVPEVNVNEPVARGWAQLFDNLLQ